MASRVFSGMDLLWKRIMAGDAGNYIQQLIDDNSPFYAGDGKIILSEPRNNNLEQPDAENAPWMTIQRYATADAHWRVEQCIYVPPEKAGGKVNIYVMARGTDDRPALVLPVVQAWPDDQAEQYTDANGVTDFPMSGDSSFDPNDPQKIMTLGLSAEEIQREIDKYYFAAFDPRQNQVGPYSIFINDGKHPTDIVRGLGLPLKRHVQYLIVFKLTAQGSKPVDPPKPDDTQTEAQAALQAASTVDWMAINNDGALWKYAKAHNLQDAQTDEIQYIYRGVQYVCQVFNLGIVYCKVNDWGNIKVVAK